MRRVFARTLALGLMVGAPASAQLTSSGNYCGTASSLPFCAAIQLSYTRAVSGTTDLFSVWLSVTSGSINSLNLRVPLANGAQFGVLFPPAVTTNGAVITGLRQLERDDSITGEQVTFWSNNGLSPVVGACGAADYTDPQLPFVYLTCDPNGGAPGSVQFDILLRNVEDPAQFLFGVNGLECAWSNGVTYDPVGSRGCTLAGAVTPEPATLAFIAPALVAIMSWRRRRTMRGR